MALDNMFGKLVNVRLFGVICVLCIIYYIRRGESTLETGK